MQSKHPIVLWGHFEGTINFNEEMLEWDGEVVRLELCVFVYCRDRTVSKGFSAYEGEHFFLHVDLDCCFLCRVACSVCSSLKVHGQGISEECSRRVKKGIRPDWGSWQSTHILPRMNCT